jgi:hypothetical protein
MILKFAKSVTAMSTLIFLQCSQAQPWMPSPSTAPAQMLSIAAEIVTQTAAEPRVVINVRNTGDRALTIADALGFCGVYFDIQLQRNGEQLTGNERELFDRPKPVCLAPQQQFTFSVSLRRMQRRFDGRSISNDYRYDALGPGDYRLRVVYVSPPVPLGRNTCDGTVGEAASPWYPLTLVGGLSTIVSRAAGCRRCASSGRSGRWATRGRFGLEQQRGLRAVESQIADFIVAADVDHRKRTRVTVRLYEYVTAILFISSIHGD